MPSGPIKLHISDVQTAVPASVGVEAGMVVLTEDEPPGRFLRIIIGQPEARAIMAAWQGATPGRPATWDLFVSTVAILGGRIDRAVITAVQEERHYFAVIELEQNGERRTLSCRPSDAIALAVRAYDADIMAEPSVLDDAGVLPDGSKLGANAGAGTSVDEREASLAAREADLAARERALAEREATTSTDTERGTDPSSTESSSTDPSSPDSSSTESSRTESSSTDSSSTGLE
ncbi:MAG TPA: bifunctional nuclease family protein [Acidimicrobiales bacterium]|nr:bifunctional nuclease family protein [Acidimicrobiales bacterium]